MKRPMLMLTTGMLILSSLAVGLIFSSEHATDHSVDQHWVSEEICASCHQPQFQNWLNSHHQLAMQPASGQSVSGDFNDHTFSGLRGRTQFFRKSDEFWVNTLGPDGTATEYPVAYTLGVDPLQQYLLKMPDGRLQAFDVAWDTRHKRWYELYPGQSIESGDILHWAGINQNANFMCIECHATGYKRNFDPIENKYASTWLMPGVGCQSCHGPASAHLEWTKTQGKAANRGFSEASLNSGNARETEVCARCHSRRSALGDGYEHRAHLMDDFLPSPLSPILYEIDGKIKDEVFEYGSFVQSRMYEAGVRCTTCHEPHTAKLRLEGNALCTQCHNPSAPKSRADVNTSALQAKDYDSVEHHRHKPRSPAAQCISCHMPARYFMVADLRHDHSFSIPNPVQAKQLGHPDACLSCHQEMPIEQLLGESKPQLTASGQHDGGYVDALYKARRGEPGAAEALIKQISRTDIPAIRKATLLAELHQYPSFQAQQAALQALTDPSPQVRETAINSLETLANAREKSRWISPLLNDPVKAVRIAAAWQLVSAETDQTSFNPSLLKALKEYEDSHLSLLERPEANLNLAELYRRTGRFEQIEPALRQALKREPKYPPAKILLAQWIEQQGDSRKAQELLQTALDQSPESADLHYALAMHLIKAGQREQALNTLRQAYELAPDNGGYAYAYAVGLFESGMQSQAVTLLDAHLAKHPADRSVRKALITYARHADDKDKVASLLKGLRMINPGDPLLR